MRSLAFALFASVFAGFAVQAAETENPYKSAKVGDTLSYKLSVKNPVGNIDGTMTQTITEKTDKEVTLKTVTKMLGNEQPAQTTKIDITKEFDPTAADGKGGNMEKLKDGTEKVKVGDKEYDCYWTTYKGRGFAAGNEMKVWLCKDVPGMVKMTATTKATMNLEIGVTMELTEIANKK